MGRRQRAPLGAEVEQLRNRVEEWRRTRRKLSPMPEELWQAAAALAREHGLNPIAQALRLDYYSLKERTGQAGGTGRDIMVRPGGFVELSAAELLGASAPSELVVELADGDGAHLRIRLTGGAPLDVVALVEAFWRRRR